MSECVCFLVHTCVLMCPCVSYDITGPSIAACMVEPKREEYLVCVIGTHRQATAGDCQSFPICVSAST